MSRKNRTSHILNVHYGLDGELCASVWHQGAGFVVTLHNRFEPTTRSLARYCRLIQQATRRNDPGVSIEPFVDGWVAYVRRTRSRANPQEVGGTHES